MKCRNSRDWLLCGPASSGPALSRFCADNPVPAPGPAVLPTRQGSDRGRHTASNSNESTVAPQSLQTPGGEDRVAAAEASLLRRHGIRVIEPDFENAIAARGRLRQTFELAAQSAWSADSYERVRKLCELHRPDVAHVHNFWLRMSPSVHTACRDAGVPTVQSLHNYRIVCVNALLLRNGTVCEACVGKVPWRGAIRRCYRGSFWASAAAAGMIVTNRLRGTWTHQAAALVTPSTHSRGKLLAAGLPRDRIFVKPNSVDDPGEPPSAPSTSDSAVFLGRLSPEKGVDVLLRAWARSKLGVYRRLVIAGDGPERAGLEQLAAGLGLRSPAVAFTGLLAPKAAQRFLRNSRVLIAPSIAYETFGLAVIEAYSHGRPVIASRLGALAELVENEVNGLSASPGDVAALGQALDRILGNARLPDTLGDNARQTFLGRYTPQKNFENLMRIYRYAIQQSGNPHARDAPGIRRRRCFRLPRSHGGCPRPRGVCCRRRESAAQLIKPSTAKRFRTVSPSVVRLSTPHSCPHAFHLSC